MNISTTTVRPVDDNTYKRGLARVKSCFGITGKKKTIAALEVMLESKEETTECQKNYIHALKVELEKPKKKYLDHRKPQKDCCLITE